MYRDGLMTFHWNNGRERGSRVENNERIDSFELYGEREREREDWAAVVIVLHFRPDLALVVEESWMSQAITGVVPRTEHFTSIISEGS